MDLKLEGKKALVTGSSGGIGRAIAKRLAQEGTMIVVHGRDKHRIDETVAEIHECGGRAIGLALDLCESDGPTVLLDQACKQLGGSIEILINNSGSYAAREFLETTPETWDEFYRADVLPAVALILKGGKMMAHQGWGRIVNIASGLATTPQTSMADYAAAKAALVNATVSASKAFAPAGVTVNTVSPGLIRTAGVERVLQDQAARRGWGRDWPTIERRWFEEVLHSEVRRLGRPEEVADLVAFIASPLADYISGANLRIDGGKSPSIN
ncbi:MAG: SDR family oxidoreductase [Bradyrhizobium sp.]|nr:SDR family oxidoreductase [Bradyrhizobium sp.]